MILKVFQHSVSIQLSSVSIGFVREGFMLQLLQMPQLLLWYVKQLISLFDLDVGVAARAGDKWLCAENVNSRSLSLNFLCSS